MSRLLNNLGIIGYNNLVNAQKWGNVLLLCIVSELSTQTSAIKNFVIGDDKDAQRRSIAAKC